MKRYFLWTLRKNLQSGRSLYLLTIFGVALGVASFLSVQIINCSALATFRGALKAVGSDADLTIQSRILALDENIFPDVLSISGIVRAWPTYELDVAVKDSGGLLLDVVGVDLLAPVPWSWKGNRGKISQALIQPGWIAITPQLARAQGWSVGDQLQVSCGPRQAQLFIGALVDFTQTSALASTKLAIMDISQAQGLLGQPGKIHQIHVKSEHKDLSKLKARLESILGPSVQVLTPKQRENEAAGLLKAFRLNLTALSLISLLVGIFVVYTSSQSLLVRRRRELGVLRSLGATRSQVLALVLAEVSIVGALGVLLGVGLGYWVARTNMDTVSATLTQLYILKEIESLQVPLLLYVLAAIVGIGAALAGAIIPTLDLALSNPKSLLSIRVMHEKRMHLVFPLFMIGMAVLIAAGSWFWFLARDWQPAGFVLGVALLVALPFFTPILVRMITSLPMVGFGIGFGFNSLATRLGTITFPVASLAIAVSMMIGVTLMTSSFRQTLGMWIQTSIQADIYVQSKSWRGRGDETGLGAELVSKLTSMEDILAVDRLRKFPVFSGNQRIFLVGVEASLPLGESRFPLLEGNPRNTFRKLEEGSVLVGETLAKKRNLGIGDSLPLSTPNGEVELNIAAIYYDYSPGQGLAVVDLDTMENLYGPGSIHSLALYLKPGRDNEEVLNRLKTQYMGQPVMFRSNLRLREEILEIFDETFAVTRLLQGMSLLIAVAGIILTLLILAREQTSELAVYRSIGAQRSQLFRFFLGKGLGLGVSGLALGLCGGIALAAILVFIINRAYFGWTIQIHWPWVLILIQVGTILGATVLASLYPALRASSTPGTQLCREDL